MSRLVRFFLPVCCLVLLTALFRHPATAMAHGAHITAWADGERVCTQSSFNARSRMANATVSMRDPRGGVLASGRSDADGLFCFPAPAPARDLLFVVEDGKGHRGETHLDAAALTVQAPHAPTVAGTADAAECLPDLLLSRQELRALVREEMQRQISPLLHALADEHQSHEPDLGDILGGVGWIVGLAALGSLWYTRGKRS